MLPASKHPFASVFAKAPPLARSCKLFAMKTPASAGVFYERIFVSAAHNIHLGLFVRVAPFACSPVNFTPVFFFTPVCQAALGITMNMRIRLVLQAFQLGGIKVITNIKRSSDFCLSMRATGPFKRTLAGRKIEKTVLACYAFAAKVQLILLVAVTQAHDIALPQGGDKQSLAGGVITGSAVRRRVVQDKTYGANQPGLPSNMWPILPCLVAR